MIEDLRTARLLHELRRAVRLAPEALRSLQERLLRRAVAHAARDVPFYRRIWSAAGVATDRVLGLDDLKRLPIILPEQVRAAAESGELLARSTAADALPRFSTGGSSGRSLDVPRGAVESRLWRAAGLRMQLEHGFRWWNTTVQFDPVPRALHPAQRLGLAPAVWISPALPVAEQIERLTAARPRFVFGSPTALRRLCGAVKSRHGDDFAPSVVFSLAEILDEDSRGTIREAFGVEPTDVYGSTETGYIAWQCEQRADLHINADLIIVEILRGEVAAAPGELGRVVVTDLRGRTMPLLRCDTGDLAIASSAPCPCGRTLPTMGPVEGRARDTFLTSSGRMLTQRSVVNRLAGTLRMGEYRLRRETERRFLLEATPRAFDGAGETGTRRVLGEMLGDIDLVVERVDALPPNLKTHAFVDNRNRR